MSEYREEGKKRELEESIEALAGELSWERECGAQRCRMKGERGNGGD
jgi:hypothetical protein